MLDYVNDQRSATSIEIVVAFLRFVFNAKLTNLIQAAKATFHNQNLSLSPRFNK
jgi:hypothetical protein